MRQPSIQKIFMNLSLVTAILFLLISGVLLQIPLTKATGYTGKLNQISVSTSNLLRMFEMEIPFFNLNVQASTTTDSIQKNDNKWLDLLIAYSTKAPNDWIKQEIPMFAEINLDNVMVSNITDTSDSWMESHPPDDFFLEEKNKLPETSNGEKEAVPVITENKNVVFIYHTHNRESFLPELDTNIPDKAYHPTKNITLVGKEVAKELNRLGIKTVISTKDYWPELEKYYLSYKYSLETVKAALQQNKDYQFIIDIHRDGPGEKDKTTRKINGEDYATIYFVIGKANKNYQKNEELALKIHQSLEKLYPGLSKGIFEQKKTSKTNGEYNQSVSPNSVIIEIGGAYNTLEEEYRTAQALAEAIADIYWDAKKVDARTN